MSKWEGTFCPVCHEPVGDLKVLSKEIRDKVFVPGEEAPAGELTPEEASKLRREIERELNK